MHIHINNSINSFIVCPCYLEARELTVAEGHKFQKEVKNFLNGDFRR